MQKKLKIIFASSSVRGIACLKRLLQTSHQIKLVIIPHFESSTIQSLSEIAEKHNIEILKTRDINDPIVIKKLKQLSPDLTVLAGFHQIVKKELIEVARKGAINLHAGSLPKYRGSSPLNWTLINGEKEFGLSIIQVDEGVDTGDILMESKHAIKKSYTIIDLHKIANRIFPDMLIDVIHSIAENKTKPKKQDHANSAYYPLRFPDDGLIVWDKMTAEEIHNTIRALTHPYPCAFAVYNRQKIKLISSELDRHSFKGYPGRVYKIEGNKLLIMARDKAIWITETEVENTGMPLVVKLYQQLPTFKHYFSYYYQNDNNYTHGYYPLHFPECRTIVWDKMTAQEIHNRISSLSRNTALATAIHSKGKVRLISSELCKTPYHGEPGRIYKKTKRGLLVGTRDQSIWITDAEFENTKEKLADHVKRYDWLPTVNSSFRELLT